MIAVRPRRLLRRLSRTCSGVAMTEFALSLPLLLTAGLWGVETANFALVTMHVNQLATHLADNGARIGDTSSLAMRKIYEGDINDLLIGSNLQGGKGLDFYEHGRAIISSLEVLPTSMTQQYIHWQRCKGKKVWGSHYGFQGDGITSAIAGMGPPGEEVQASIGDAVIFVEVAYDYQPLILDQFVSSRQITATASFIVRDSRDLTQIYQRDPNRPSAVSGCSAYSSISSTFR